MTTPLPWKESTAPNRVPPRQCVGAARDALSLAYGIGDRAAVPLLIQAVDWLRRALEQMDALGSDEPREDGTVRVNADVLARLLVNHDPGGFYSNALGLVFVDDGTGVARKLIERYKIVEGPP